MDLNRGAHQRTGWIRVVEYHSTLVGHIDGGREGRVGPDIVKDLAALVHRADNDPGISAVVLIGASKGLFAGESEVVASPPQIDVRVTDYLQDFVTSIVDSFARGPFKPMDLRIHRRRPTGFDYGHQMRTTFEAMRASGTVFVAAMNGSAIGVGAEIAWACDVRLMANGNFRIGHPTSSSGVDPAGTSRRLADLIGVQKSLLALINGHLFSAEEALKVGAIDEIVPRSMLLERALSAGDGLNVDAKESTSLMKRAIYTDRGLSTSRR